MHVINCRHFMRHLSVKANFICIFGVRDCCSLHVLQSTVIRGGTEVNQHSTSAQCIIYSSISHWMRYNLETISANLNVFKRNPYWNSYMWIYVQCISYKNTPKLSRRAVTAVITSNPAWWFRHYFSTLLYTASSGRFKKLRRGWNLMRRIAFWSMLMMLMY